VKNNVCWFPVKIIAFFTLIPISLQAFFHIQAKDLLPAPAAKICTLELMTCGDKFFFFMRTRLRGKIILSDN